MAAVLVHIDLDGDQPHVSSLQALAAGRALASSWGATLYAAVIARDPDPGPEAGAAVADAVRIPGDGGVVETIRSALARRGADKIVVALSDAQIAPLWSAVGTVWQGVLERLRPRLVVFGADAPSAAELGPRSAARIGARLLLRARVSGGDDVELRDRDGSHVRSDDSGAAVVLVGTAPRLAPHGDEDIDVLVLALPGGADPRVELASSAPAGLAHATGNLIAVGDDIAGNPEIARATRRLAELLGAQVVGSATAASTGLVGAGAVLEPGAALVPELCISVGLPTIDLAGSASLVRIGSTGGKGVDGALGGPIADHLVELTRLLENR